ncbi:MAG: NAD(P)-dependent oxidoreductase [Micromonosporaceae bacterium]
MRLTILGATGGIGRALIDQALREGHTVTAVVRDPARLDHVHERLDLQVADVTDPESLRPAVKGADAVLVALGPRSLRDSRTTTINSSGVRAAIAAMEETDVSRLVVVSAAPVAEPAQGDTLAFKVFRGLLWRVMPEHYRDLTTMERQIRQSGLRWTVVRPPKLTDGPATRRYRTAYGRPVGNRISRADVADALLRALTDERTVGAALGVGN